MIQIHKYPRTHHIQGSRLQPGDEDLDALPWETLAGGFLVIEEKMDGANAGVSFNEQGQLLLQSRGHYLTGGPREKHFALFKTWANTHAQALWEVLGSHYVMYGEWLFARHTIFYNALTHYFMEFDVLDTRDGRFLSTAARRKLFKGCAFLEPVKVLHEGEHISFKAMTALVEQSHFIEGRHLEQLRTAAEERNLDSGQVLFETDPTNLMEGLYIKVEKGDEVIGRYKFVRPGFLTTVLNAKGHWLDRPIIPNQLKAGTDLFAI